MQRLTGEHGAEYRAEQELRIQSITEHSGLHAALNKLRKTLLRRNKHLIGNRIQRRIIGRKHHANCLQTKLTVEKTALNALQYRQQTVFDNSTSLKSGNPATSNCTRRNRSSAFL